MEYVSHYVCTICHSVFDKNESIYTCNKCGEKGILDVVYDYDILKKKINKEYFEKHNDFSIWRYRELMSVRNKNLDKTLKVGWTPLYNSNLSKQIGVKELWIKDEGLNPTASLKDRASVVACIKAVEEGKQTIACSSTGNAASSLAGNAARLGLKTVIFVPKRAPIAKLTQLLVYGAKVVSVIGDYKDTFELSKQAIDYWGWYNRNAAINPHLVEGKKTVAYEICEQLNWKVPDWVAVSVGDGCTIGGVYKGFYDMKQLNLIDRVPKILGVQAEGCSPFYTSYKENRPLEPTAENTIADSISVGVPRNPVKAMNAVEKSKGTWITVMDDEILKSIKTLGSNEGIFGEPAGVTGLAGVIKAVSNKVIKSSESVAVIITGNGLKDVNNALKACSEPITIKPDLEVLKSKITE